MLASVSIRVGAGTVSDALTAAAAMSILARMGQRPATPRAWLPWPPPAEGERNARGDRAMSIVVPFLVLLLVGAFAAYHRMRLATWAAITAAGLAACWLLGANITATVVATAIVALVAMPLLLPVIRKPLITAPLLKFYRKILPPLSQTERIALEAGSVGFEGELFSGAPDWNVLMSQPKPELTAEELAFLDGPVEELCRMTDDWDITHVRADLPPELWQFMKDQRFFGMIIPKEYGGLGFSALAHHKVI